MPPRIDNYWLGKVRAIAANEPRLGPQPISARLDAEAEELRKLDPKDDRVPAPSPRWIASRLAEIRAPDQEALRQQYREMHWPESFRTGALPWESAEMALELLKVEQHGRPLVGNVLWCWHIKQTRPSLKLTECWRAACYMSAWEAAPDSNPHIPAAIEAWLRGIGSLDGLKIDGRDASAVEALYGAVLAKQEAEGEA